MVNSSITIEDILRGQDIFGTPIPLLQGNMKRKHPSEHPKITSIPLDLLLGKRNRDITLFIDVFFVNKLPFYLSKLARINFLSVKSIGSRKASELRTALKNDMNKYTSIGFNIRDIHADNEFDVELIKN